MLDWEFADETEEFPDLPEESATRWRPTRRFWLLLAGVVLIVLVSGAGAFAWRLHDRRRAMREDLTALVYREDQARFAGLADRADELVAPGVPEAWQERYRDTFRPYTPDRITVENVQVDGDAALVTVRLDDHEQVRFYRLVGREWRRAPVPPDVWGDRQTLYSGDAAIVYRPRDRDVAQDLADRLPTLLDALAVWQRRPSVDLIAIEPSDLHLPIVGSPVSGEDVILNSPRLVPFNDVLPGAATLRLALAERLVRQAGGGTINGSSLPGNSRFLEAVHSVVAMHAALSPAEQQHMVDAWRSRLDGTWVSPFYVPTSAPFDTLGPEPANAAMLLLVDHLYRTHGVDVLRDLVRTTVEAESWDTVFEQTIGGSSLSLERDAAEYARAADSPNLTGTATPSFPITARVTAIDRDRRPRLHVRSSGNDPSLVADVAVSHARIAPDNLRLAVGCVGERSTVQFAGEWLEVGRRFRATNVTVPDLQLPDVLTFHRPPDDAAAYLLDTRGSLVLVALRGDGTTTPVLSIADDDGVIDSITPLDTGERTIFTVDVRATGCSRRLTYLYDPAEGITETWIMHQTVREPIWRPDHEDFLIIRGVSARIGHYGVLNEEAATTPQTVTTLNAFLRPRGWSAATDRLLVEDVRSRQGGFSAVSLVDPVTNDVRRLNLARWPTTYHLTADGRWLAYVTRPREGTTVPNKLHVRQLDYHLNTIPIQLRAGDGLRLVPQRYPPDNRIMLWAGPVENENLVPTRLLVIDPDETSNPIVVDERTDRPLVASVLCHDDRVLYKLADAEGAVLMQTHDDAVGPRVLLADATHLEPLTCPRQAAGKAAVGP